MIPYNAPTRDMAFVMKELGLLAKVAALPGFEEATEETVDAILEEAGKVASEVIAPINYSGDKEGVAFENGVVRTPEGFPEAYGAFVEGGWSTLAFDPDYGGQGLPWLVATAVQEMWKSANLAWSHCTMLTQGSVELLQEHGTEAQKATYLGKLISGEWTGTMNLTEPDAGSDVGALKCKAEPNGDHYLIRGQKIFITYGEHDMAENIVHMVLARTPEAPPGARGISLFLVPKHLVNKDGSLGPHNDLRCVSVEEKLGIHASPTCVLAFGDNEGAVGTLIGEENQGLRAMFTMMNNARLSVGLEGVAIAERAYQKARDYALERIQGTDDAGGSDRVAIIRHPDVRRMLMTMRAYIEAMRAVAYDTAATLDAARRHPDDEARRAAQSRLELLTPICKAWSTDLGIELTSLAIQVHGGAGFIEETGIAQFYRDARISPIYEGTNGIQARDLVGRKVLRDKGAAMGEFLDDLAATIADLEDGSDDCAALKRNLGPAADALKRATDWLVAEGGTDAARAYAGATPYLKLFGTVAGGAMMARAARAAEAGRQTANGDAGFYEAKLVTARFYAEHVLPQAAGLAAEIMEGADSVMALPEDRF